MAWQAQCFNSSTRPLPRLNFYRGPKIASVYQDWKSCCASRPKNGNIETLKLRAKHRNWRSASVCQDWKIASEYRDWKIVIVHQDWKFASEYRDRRIASAYRERKIIVSEYRDRKIASLHQDRKIASLYQDRKIASALSRPPKNATECRDHRAL